MNFTDYTEASKILYDNGFFIDTKESEYKGSTKYLCFHDKENYMYTNFASVKAGKHPDRFNPHNEFTIFNINNFFSLSDIPFECISKEYKGKNDILEFKCNRCDTIVKNKWGNVYRNAYDKGILKHGKIICPNCDGYTESQHALILKQIFMHEYPDTIVEDPSCINPSTNRSMPTDIVNHNLKIAIEIQSEFHDYKKERDELKKNYWINRKYKFYALDIRDYSILEMCQVFFNIDSIPDYVDFTYGRKLDLKTIQEMLDKNIPVLTISKELNISSHRIYDAIHYKKLHYSSEFHNNSYSPVVQLDLDEKFISVYPTIKEAGERTGVLSSNISSCLNHGKNYSSGFYWMYKHDYDNNKPIKKTRLKTINIIKNA